MTAAGAKVDHVSVLRTLNVEIAQWEQRRNKADARRLDEVMARDLVFRRADKNVVRKREFMKSLEGPSPFLRRASEDVHVDVRGNRAVVVLTVVATKPDGSTHRYRNIRFFVRRDRTWRLTSWFNDDVTAVTGLD
jgi:hypothetical protein